MLASGGQGSCQAGLSVAKQCEILRVSEATCYRKTAGASEEEKEARKAEREKKLAEAETVLSHYGMFPVYGYKRMSEQLLLREGLEWATEKVIRRLYKELGLRGLVATFKTTRPARHPYGKFPYLLGDMVIRYSNQAWATDINYIDGPEGRKLYYLAVIDLLSRKILSWRLSDTMEVGFCLEAVREAVEKYGVPSVAGTDQGSQFTSEEFVGLLESYGMLISNDGRARWADNVIVERTWKTLKYEWVFLREYRSEAELRKSLGEFQSFFNERRLHEGLGYRTPNEVYNEGCFPVWGDEDHSKEDKGKAEIA